MQGFDVLKREIELDNAAFGAKHWFLLLVEFKPIQLLLPAPVFYATLTLLQKPVVLVKLVDKWAVNVEVSQWELIALGSFRVDVPNLVSYQLVNFPTVDQVKFQLI
jgi:hypothetical protein